MPGFFMCNKKIHLDLVNLYPEKCISKEFSYKNFTIKSNSLRKFEKDKCFFLNESYIILQEGYLLNKQELYTKYDASDVENLIMCMYTKNGDEFFNEFKGSFSGILYDIKLNKWLIYSDHFGSKPIYYSIVKDFIFVGSQVNYVIEALKKSGFQLTLNEHAAYELLTFSFIASNDTIANEISRLPAGSYLKIEKNVSSVIIYHRFTKNMNRFKGVKEKDIIQEIDKLFTKAVNLQYEKDNEYGYKHLADISGGLDSRMAMWVRHEAVPTHMQLVTYCKANYLDEIISKQIAKYWKDELLIKSLDDASFLFDIDELVFMLGGTSLYCGITGGKQLLQSLNMDVYGLEHTGMVGDAVIGSFFSSKSDITNNKPSGKYSERLASRLSKNVIDNYYDYEIYLLYTRGLHGAMNTYQIRSNYTEAASPFLDVDFFQLCLDIPVELRIKHYIYKKWILEKHPNASKFKWEKINAKITTSPMIIFLKKVLKKGPQKILRIIHKDNKIVKGMNPIDYWIDNDENLKRFIQDTYNDFFILPNIEISNTLKKDINFLFETGNALEKTMVLTLIKAVQLYFGDYDVKSKSK